MGKSRGKAGKEWTKQDISELRRLAKQNADTDIIANKLQRTKAAIYTKASEEGISLKPKDKK